MEEAIIGRRSAHQSSDHEKTYRDPDNPRRDINDQWDGGRLARRDFRVDGHLIARDEFLYDGGVIVGKTRTYMSDDQAVSFRDTFAQDGVLTEKRSLGSGSYYLDIMRSPIPPDSDIFLPVGGS